MLVGYLSCVLLKNKYLTSAATPSPSAMISRMPISPIPPIPHAQASLPIIICVSRWLSLLRPGGLDPPEAHRLSLAKRRQYPA